MTEILFATWDGGGNVPPAVAIATELRRRGATVRFLGHEAQREALTAAGFEFSAYGDGFVGAEANSVPRVLGMFTDRRMGAAVLEELRRRPADVVVADCLLVGVLKPLADAGQRYVVLEHLFDAYLRGAWLKGPMGLVARLKGLRPASSWDRAEACLVVAPPSLDPAHARPAAHNVSFVGPAVEVPAPHDLGSHEPTVLVSLSTYHYAGMQEAMQRILDATAGLPARVVVTTGPAIDPDGLRKADNHEVHRFVPHDRLMPETTLVVGHGGHATTMRALAHDLPLLVIPMHPMLDQPMVGRAVSQAGAGEVLPKKASPDRIRAAVQRLLADGPHRRAAARLGTEIRALDGTRRAADVVLSLVGDGAATLS
jgi:UDP:flavonoid glycosyltransferase YjiC (YdhE family)